LAHAISADALRCWGRAGAYTATLTPEAFATLLEGLKLQGVSRSKSNTLETESIDEQPQR